MAQGDAITVTDTASIDAFGPQANAMGWPHNDLLQVNDSDVLALIRTVLAQQKNDFIGISSIDLDADYDREHLYGVLSALLSKGIGNQAFFDVHYVHPDGDTLDDSVRIIGLHGNISVDAPGRVKFTATVRTVKNQGPVIVPPQWATATSYSPGDYVEDGGVLYLCYNANTSDSTNEPGSGVDYLTYWEAP